MSVVFIACVSFHPSVSKKKLFTVAFHSNEQLSAMTVGHITSFVIQVEVLAVMKTLILSFLLGFVFLNYTRDIAWCLTI